MSLYSLRFCPLSSGTAAFNRWGANRAGIFIHLMPVFSILLAIAFLDERLQAFHMVGIGLIFSGIVLTTWPGRTGG
jgi:drug/metabolite transporter (DMT)-like permease